MNILDNPRTGGIGILKDPFNKEKVSSIMFYITEDFFKKPNLKFECYIHFKNGDTEGKQTISAANFDDLVLKAKHFIDNL